MDIPCQYIDIHLKKKLVENYDVYVDSRYKNSPMEVGLFFSYYFDAVNTRVRRIRPMVEENDISS